MKREIKFRVWNGAEMDYDILAGRFGAFYVNPGASGDGLDEQDRASLSPFNTKYSDVPVMQYTGLNDKNGKEIYEGDIVQFTIEHEEEIDDVTYKEAVHFSEGCFNVDGEVPLNAFSDECEVIGNIYENPELLNNP